MMGIPRGRRKGRIGDGKKGSSGIIEVVGEEGYRKTEVAPTKYLEGGAKVGKTVLSQDLGSVSSIHMEAHNHQ